MIMFDFKTYTKKFITDEEINYYSCQFSPAKEYIYNQTEGMRGWLDLDDLFKPSLIKEINDTGDYIRNNCDVFLVVGIGGSYLASYAPIETIKSYVNNNNCLEIYHIGPFIDGDSYAEFLEKIKEKQIIVNFISKSGTTLEVNIYYQLLMNLMKEKYDFEEIRKRVIITTNDSNGYLYEETLKLGCKKFIIPENVGGRFSVFTPAGLLPMSVANIDINLLYNGAKEGSLDLDNAFKYAVIRKIMANKGKKIEAFVAYNPSLIQFIEWLKQLYAESLGKNGQGIFPVSLINVRDLHSFGQYIQDGDKIVFETVINVLNSKNKVIIDKYNKDFNEINKIAQKATSQAHYNGGVLNNMIIMDEINIKNLGYLFQFFMISCAMSGYLEGVNPFDQDGVEDYKKIMKQML